MKRPLLTALLSLSLPAAVLAHEAHGEHIMGTLTAVRDAAIDLRAKADKTVTIALGEKVELLKLEDGKEVAATRADLQVDRRVVVDVTKEGEKLIATRIVISPAPKADGGHGDHKRDGHESHKH